MQTVSQKKFLFILLVIAGMIFLCGCGNGNSAGQQENIDASDAVRDVNAELTALFEANNGSDLLDSVQAVQTSAVYNADGYQETVAVSRIDDGKLIFLESGDDYQRVVLPDQGYYQTRDGMQSQLVFIGEQYDKIYLQQRLPQLTWGKALTEWTAEKYPEGEADNYLSSAGQIADELTADTRCDLEFTESDQGKMTVSISWQNDSGRFTDRYLYDRSSHLIIQVDSYQQPVNGKEELICTKQISCLSDYQAELPDFVLDMQQADKRRLVTFVADPGTATEKRYECDAPVTAFVSPFYDSEYGLYADAEGKQPFTAQPADTDGTMPDAVIYLIKNN